MFDWQWQREKDKLHSKITDLEKKLDARSTRFGDLADEKVFTHDETYG